MRRRVRFAGVVPVPAALVAEILCSPARGKVGLGALAALPMTAAPGNTRNGPGVSGTVTTRPIRVTLDPAMTFALGSVMSLPVAMLAPPKDPTTCKAPGRH
ncbi:MAG: hypothetical protein IOD05_13100 [Rhodobacter sp.]|nr:hypothetical protein [Rhodobacter sp.]MCA3494109.1 hypothetical protein [Rhodobacter sp.]MCA3500439.1 hypothetical protein [Rhodobacter sp.]MCA3504159.1 hypothetical protein [Rhodobacter sp.]MCA3517296.1 hypothetical protein [Rhodobacter sp.]